MAVRWDTQVYAELVSCFHALTEEGHPTCLRYNRLFRERDNAEESADLLTLTKSSIKLFRSYFIS